MYVPDHFAPPGRSEIYAALERYSFALLVSNEDGVPTASHLPLLIDRNSDTEAGTLLGHMARANSQWRSATGQIVLAVFSGPHAYISPQWYEAEHVVPTWNYIAVHVYGRLELIEDEGQVEALLHRTIRQYEGSRQQPWQLNDSAEFVSRLIKQIVAFRIPIERLEGKWKLNQNHPPERRAQVIAALEQSNDDNSLEIARLMR